MRNKLQDKLTLQKELLDWEEIYLRIKALAVKTNQPAEAMTQLDVNYLNIRDGLRRLIIGVKHSGFSEEELHKELKEIV